jgi:hypothetical protein
VRVVRSERLANRPGQQHDRAPTKWRPFLLRCAWVRGRRAVHAAGILTALAVELARTDAHLSGHARMDDMEKNPHAVALGRLGGAKGGRARARALTAEQRQQIARRAAAARSKSLSPKERQQLARRAALARWSPAARPAETVRSWLRDRGAPLTRTSSANDRAPDREQVLVEGLRLAHLDASVARALPVMIWKNRDRLRLAELVRRARRANEGATLGFFLDLTSALAGHHPFTAVSADLRKDLPGRNVFFFSGAEETLVGKELAALNTPDVARRWRFLMNMPFDSFEVLFRKHLRAPLASRT